MEEINSCLKYVTDSMFLNYPYEINSNLGNISVLTINN